MPPTLARSGRTLKVGFLVLSAFIAAAVAFSLAQQSGDAVVRRALGIEVELADLFSALQDAEIGQRGFLLTSDDAFLTPYRNANARLDLHMDALGAAIRGIQALELPFERLRAIAARKQAEMARTLELHKTGQEDQALAIVRDGEGKRLMDAIRAQIEILDTHEDEIVAKRDASLRLVGVLTAASTLVAVALLGLVALAAMREVRRRAELSRFLPAEIAPRLAEGDATLEQGVERRIAIVFVDIRGSTEMAGRLAVASLSALLTDFRDRVAEAARRHGGLVDKFIGDAALVVFGAHELTDGAAAQAVAFGRSLASSWAMGSLDRPAYEIAIGIHYGPAFCGIVGTQDRREFTVLGDAVNVASRLEQECKLHGVVLLVSEAAIVASGEPRQLWTSLGRTVLRGRREATEAFAPLDLQTLRLFSSGI